MDWDNLGKRTRNYWVFELDFDCLAADTGSERHFFEDFGCFYWVIGDLVDEVAAGVGCSGWGTDSPSHCRIAFDTRLIDCD